MKRTLSILFLTLGLIGIRDLAPAQQQAPQQQAPAPMTWAGVVQNAGTAAKDFTLWASQPVRNHPKKIVALVTILALLYLYPTESLNYATESLEYATDAYKHAKEYATDAYKHAKFFGNDFGSIVQRFWYGEESIRKFEDEFKKCLFKGHVPTDVVWIKLFSEKMPWKSDTLQKCLAETMIKNPHSVVSMDWLQERIPGMSEVLQYCAKNPGCMQQN